MKKVFLLCTMLLALVVGKAQAQIETVSIPYQNEVNDPLVLDLGEKSLGTVAYIYDHNGNCDVEDCYYDDYCSGYLLIQNIPEGMALQLSGTAKTEEGCDYLSVINPANDEELCRFSGEDVSVNVVVTSQAMLYFYSDHSVQSSGIELIATLRNVTDDFVYNDDQQTVLVGYVGEDGDVVIPASVKTIYNNAFSGRDYVESVDLSQATGLTTIGDYAFSGTGLTTITIPGTVKNMGTYAFYECANLEEILCAAPEEPEEWNEDWNYAGDDEYFPVVWGYFDGTPVEAYQINGDYGDFGLTSDYDGYYAIASAANLYWFAEYVNSGEGASANAVLVNDIVVNKDVLDEEGNLNGDLDDNNFIQWTPIGAEESEIYFLGTFDGNGHTISGLYFFDESCGTAGLIANCYKAIIKNVGVIDSYLHGDFDVGGILGYSDGSSSISNCFNTSTIIASDGCAGGICGYNGGCLINNCFNTGKISGDHYVGAIVGQKDHVIRNCYYLSGCATDGAGTIQNGVGSEELDNTVEDVEELYSATSGEFKSGYVAYMLNGESSDDVIFYQDLGDDDFPCLDSNHGTVYMPSSDAHPYSNNDNDEHCFNSNGFCMCGEYEEAEYNPEDDYYIIGNAGQLYWFAEYVNDDNTYANAILECDIEVNKNVFNANGGLNDANSDNFMQWDNPIGSSSSYSYQGTFDGRGHTISGLYCDDGDVAYKGLFGYVGNYAEIKNLGIINSHLSAWGYIGAFAVELDGGTITNCYSTSTLYAGNSRCGGICCTNKGGTITNCFVTGNVMGYLYVGAIAGTSEEYNGSEPVIENCFYLVGCATNSSGYAQGGIGCTESYGALSDVEGQCTAATTDEFASGKIAYLLNDYLGYYDVDDDDDDDGDGDGYDGDGDDGDGEDDGDGYDGDGDGEGDGDGDDPNGDDPDGDDPDDDECVDGHDYDDDYYCIRCGAFQCDEEGHDYVDYYCSRCGALECDEYGHDYGDDYYCTRCNAFQCEEEGHDFDGEYCIRCGEPNPDWEDDPEPEEDNTFYWYQTLGENGDATPTFKSSHGMVYQTSPCTAAYTNKKYDTELGHKYGVDGVCTACGDENGYVLTLNKIDDADEAADFGLSEDYIGFYTIGNSVELYNLAEYVNGGGIAINVVLVNDITVNNGVLDEYGNLNGDLDDNDFTEWTPIGTTDHYFSGTFDGNGHTVSGLYFYNTSIEHVGLIGDCRGATIKNVGVIDSYLHGYFDVGGILGYSDGSSSITNCFNSSTIVATDVNGSVAGGICGYNGGCPINNCYNTGKISGESYYIGAIAGDKDGDINNCYYLAGCATDGVGTVQNGVGYEDTGSTEEDAEGLYSATADEFASGYVAYQLNAGADVTVYYQALGEDNDAIPSLDSNRGMVYITEPCVTYTNDGNNTHLEHDYDDNGVCSRCGDDNGPVGPSLHQIADADDAANFGLSEDYIGFYTIGNSDDLYLFAEMVNSGSNTANAVLVDDIEVNSGILDAEGELDVEDPEVIDFMAWTPIGTNNLNYSGTFDGNGHTISGLYFNDTRNEGYPNGGNYVGLVGFSNGATIENVNIFDTYFNGRSCVGSICGLANGATHITNCHNSGSISAKYDISELTQSYQNDNVGGICGYLQNQSAVIEGCSNTGNIYAFKDVAGGICGFQSYGTIKNCFNTGSIYAYTIGDGNESSNCGGICGYVSSRCSVINCYNTGRVEGYGKEVGGICGTLYDSDGDEGTTVISNCFTIGNVSGSGRVGGVYGYQYYGTTSNCYILNGSISGNNTNGGDFATREQFRSGYVAYEINNYAGTNVFYQTLGENGDAIPSFDSNRGTVYMTSPCESYGNSEYKAHEFNDNGFCTVCGAFEEADYDEEANVYLIANAGQLYWFANYVNSGNTTANAELTADITVNNGVLDSEGDLNTDDVDDFMAWTPIGYDDYPFEGTFNGNGYTVNGLYFYNENGSSYPIGGRFVGLVGYSNGANIRNVGLVDSYLNGYWNVAGICGYNSDYDNAPAVAIENCWNASTIKGTGAVAGIFSEGLSTITSCYNLGSISGDNYVAGIVAYSDNGSVSMCFNVGTVSGSSQVGGIYGEYNGYAYECYVLEGSVSSNNTNGGDFATREQFRSGYVAYEINNYAGTNVFYQTLGKDAIPTLDNTHGVVTKSWPCESYNNDDITYKDHEYVNGICACGLLEPASQDDGIYHIANAGQLYWFADYVNNTDNYASAVLDDNIVVNEGVLNDDGTLSSNSAFFKEWTPIGTENNYYYGIFDGQGHTISGLYFYNTTYETYPNGGKYVGLIGASGGATIQNVGVIDSYLHGSFDVGGIIGYSNGSSSITNCFNTSTIIASNSNDDASCAGGICGYNGYCTINNCYNTGKVGGNGYYIGAIVGQKADNGEIYNSYYLYGCATDGAGCTQYGSGSNSLNSVMSESGTESVAARDFASGAVAYMLNENGEYVWYQDLYDDELPSLDGSKTLVTGYIQDVYYNYMAVGDVVLATDYEIAEGQTLVVVEGSSLATTGDAEITVNGEILFNGGMVVYNGNQITLGEYDEVNTTGAVVCYNSYSNGQIQVVAEPADGHRFVKWSDNESTNPSRTISLDASGEYIAEFEPITYQVTVLATNGGTVKGAEEEFYPYGTEITITATPDDGMYFVKWSNGEVFPSASINVESDTVVTADFRPIQTVVEGETNVVGYYREVQYNPNYVFIASTTGTYVITTKAGFDTYGYLYDGNKGYITYNDDAETNQFKIYHDCEEGETYYIGAAFYNSSDVGEEINLLVKAPVKVEAEVIGEGYVEGIGTYTWGNSVSLTAHAGEGYKFYRWSNGYTQETLWFTADEDTTVVAQFIDENLNVYSVSAYSNDYDLGVVEGSGNYIEGETATLTANATDHYHFVQWNDGDNANPRSVEVTDNLEFEAIFAIDTFYVSVVADNGEVVYGEGEYAWGEYAYIGVEANTGYHFSYWADDNTTSRTRSYLVQGNATLTAVIEPNYYDVDATYVGNGSIEGIGNYAFGTEVTLTAVPATGYHFVKWSDDVTTAKRTVTVSTSNNNYLAYFEINTYDVTVETEYGTVDGVKNGKYTHG